MISWVFFEDLFDGVYDEEGEEEEELKMEGQWAFYARR
jgi:hypothetical protein